MPPRNKHFHTREPFKDDDRLALDHAEGPFGFLNPTRAHFLYPELSKQETGVGLAKRDTDKRVDNTAQVHDQGQDQEQDQRHARESDVSAKNVRFLWRSRDNRKGRHALLVQRPRPGEESHFLTPRRTSHPREVLKNIVRTFTCFPIWDISWLVAFIFTWGSVVWVMNVGTPRWDEWEDETIDKT